LINIHRPFSIEQASFTHAENRFSPNSSNQPLVESAKLLYQIAALLLAEFHFQLSSKGGLKGGDSRPYGGEIVRDAFRTVLM
jgi:hypothetical protein